MRTTTLVCILAILPVTAVAAPKPPASPSRLNATAPPRVVAATPAVIDVEKTKLTKDQFDKLPDSQVLELHGQQETVGVLRARLKTFRARRAAGKTWGAPPAEAFQAFREQFLAEQNAAIASRNAQVLAEFERARKQNILVEPR